MYDLNNGIRDKTSDFKEFKVSTLNGPAAKNKGMALFPRKVNGNYMMLERQDNESLYIMTSDNLYFWYNYRPLAKPTYGWELIQIGNCGAPIEVDEGWLGYVPNVLYTCDAMALDRTLVLPYAVGDAVTTFALVSIDEIIAHLES